MLFYDLSELTIREIIVHPNYTRTAEPNYNDVAVVKLESPVKFIPTICGWYDEFDSSYELGVKAVVTEKFQSGEKNKNDFVFNIINAYIMAGIIESSGNLEINFCS